jgi:hypothetical protein
MSESDAPQTAPEDRRRDVFRALVEAQDAGRTVPDSRQDIARRFGLSEPEVRAIEREGIEHNWPPL